MSTGLFNYRIFFLIPKGKTYSGPAALRKSSQRPGNSLPPEFCPVFGFTFGDFFFILEYRIIEVTIEVTIEVIIEVIYGSCYRSCRRTRFILYHRGAL
jgi:hypothetical protein